MVKKVDRKGTEAPKPTTLAEGLAKALGEAGQPVSPTTAAILEADLDEPVNKAPIVDLEIPQFEANTGPLTGELLPESNEEVVPEPIVEPVVETVNEPVVEPVVETITTEQEAVTMENATEQKVVDTQAAIAAAQPAGMMSRAWGWAKNNKGKLAIGAAAVVGVGVGVYYLVRTGNVDKAVDVASTAVTEATAAVADTAAQAV